MCVCVCEYLMYVFLLCVCNTKLDYLLNLICILIYIFGQKQIIKMVKHLNERCINMCYLTTNTHYYTNIHIYMSKILPYQETMGYYIKNPRNRYNDKPNIKFDILSDM